MVRLPRIVSCLTLACLAASPLLVRPAFALDDTTPPTAAPAGGDAPAADNSGAGAAPDSSATPAPGAGATAAPSDSTAAPAAADSTAAPADQTASTQPSLNDLVDTFWHFGKIARYDLAADAGNKILAANSDPLATLNAFESVAGKRNDNIDYWMLRWESLPIPEGADASLGIDTAVMNPRDAVMKMRQVSAKLVDQINAGYEARRSDPVFIRKTIVEMSTGERAYDNNLPRISKSGELAVEALVDILRTPADQQYNDVARRILRDLGRKALSPLCAATEMKDYGTLIDVISALGDIGYDAAVPYLQRIDASPDAPAAIHTAAKNALAHLNASGQMADNFYSLGEKIYYGKADIAPSGDKIAFIWFWTPDHGLTKRNVPTPIFGDVMAMREAEYAMKLDPSNSNAVSLWLAANTKREIDLPPGSDDPTHRDISDAHYYNVSAGVTYLEGALARAMKDRNTALSLKLTRSLHDIIGQSNMSGAGNEPITQALLYPNRQVRYEAAFAVAQSLPTKPFPGSDRVVPLLVEAMRQTSKPSVLVVAPTQNNQLATISEAIKSLGYTVATAENPGQAAGAASQFAAVNIIVISEDSDVRTMIELEQDTAHLQGASVIVLTHVADNPFVVRSATDPLMNAIVMPPKSVLADALKTEIETARQHAGAAILTDQQAADRALRAAAILSKIAIARGTILDLTVAQGGVLTALKDPRPEIAKAAGQVLEAINTAVAQQGLAIAATDTTIPTDVRANLLRDLAGNAKFFGNQLDADKIADIEAIVNNSADSSLREAAAEARGALNLPADQARALILKQSHT